jgi:hypothetical protein
MNRTNFFNVETVRKINELDFLHNSLSEFTMQYPPTYYRVNGVDLMRPFLISYRHYGTVNFWWIIMLVNGISNPLTGMTAGMTLKIPSKEDIYAFQKKFRVRRST